MGGENSKDLPLDESIDNSYISQGGSSKMNMTLVSGDAQSSRSKGKKATTFLGLKTNTQFVDTSISQYEDKTLDAILIQFYDQLMRDKDKNYRDRIAETFVSECAEGFQFLVNILDSSAAKDRDPEKLYKMRLTTLKIIHELCDATEDGDNLFFGLKDAQVYLLKYFKSIVRSEENKEKSNYTGNGEPFSHLIDCMTIFARDHPMVTYETLFKKCKFIQNVSPMMLDSDGIQVIPGVKNEKIDILKKLFEYVEFCTNEDRPQKMAKSILEMIYKQPGLIANMIFNLNNPKDDDPEILCH